MFGSCQPEQTTPNKLYNMFNGEAKDMMHAKLSRVVKP